MKKQLANQDILIAEVVKDMETIPSFIDGKVHKSLWRLMQSVLCSIMKLIKPVFLTPNQIANVYKAIENDLVLIGIVDDTELYTVVSIYLYEKVEGYYHKALELELYETVENLKKYFEME